MGTRKIVTPVGRATFVNLIEPKKTDNGGYCYEVTLLFDKTEDMSQIQAIVNEAIQEKWKGNPPKTGVVSPIRFGAWKTPQNPNGFDLDKYPEYADKWVICARSYTTMLSNGQFDLSKRPGVVGPNPLDIFDPNVDRLYSGMYGRAQINAYVPTKGNVDRVALGLSHFQKCYDGDPLGGSNGKPENAFDAFIPPAGVGNNAGLLGV